MGLLISVIIPAHNEEHYLGQTLDALARQTYPRCEFIVVANGCTDKTLEVAQAKCHKLIHLRERSLGRARNLGGCKARGDLLLFLDADTILEKHALETIAHQFTRNHAMGTLKGVPDSTKPAYRLMYSFKNLLHQSRLHYGSSGVMICWKDHFEAIGGFDEALHVRENSDLMKKLRKYGRYCYISGASARTSMRRYERRGMGPMILLWIKLWLVSFVADLRHRTYEAVR